VNLPYANWDAIRGLSIGARASRVSDPDEAGKIGALMLKKFPQIANYAAFGSVMDMALFRVSPEVISILDYSKGFGHTELVRL